MNYFISEYCTHDLWEEYGSSHILAQTNLVTLIHYAGDATPQSLSWKCLIGNINIYTIKAEMTITNLIMGWFIYCIQTNVVFVLLTTLYRTNDINYYCVIKFVSDLRQVDGLSLSYYCVIKFVSDLRQVGGITICYYYVIKIFSDLRQVGGLTLSYNCVIKFLSDLWQVDGLTLSYYYCVINLSVTCDKSVA